MMVFVWERVQNIVVEKEKVLVINMFINPFPTVF